MKVLISLALVAVLGLSACADNSPGGKAAHERHQRFEELGAAFKSVNDQLKGKGPNLVEIRTGVDKIAALAPQVQTWFPKGSGPQDGKRTDAKAEAWTRPAEFQQAAGRLIDATNALKATTITGDLTAIAASAKTVGAACKGCHDKFKDD